MKQYKKVYNWVRGGSPIKPLKWVGSSRKDVSHFPPSVRRDIGVALYVAQIGEVHPDAKPLKGFGGASVLEVVSVDHSGTYRAVYTVRT